MYSLQDQVRDILPTYVHTFQHAKSHSSFTIKIQYYIRRRGYVYAHKHTQMGYASVHV